MYIIITGSGRMGGTLAKELANEGHDIAVIDRDSGRLNALGSGFNGNRITGVEYDMEVLRLAGIEYAGVFLAMTPDDNLNIASAQVARDIFKVPRVIARINDPQKEFIYRKLAIETICPTLSGAYLVRSRILEYGATLITSLDPEYVLVEIISASHANRGIGWYEEKFNCRIPGIVRGNKTHLAQQEDKILHGDRLICMVTATDKQRLIEAVTGEVV